MMSKAVPEGWMLSGSEAGMEASEGVRKNGGRIMRQFDIAVIGGGPGGYIAAIRAAKTGKKTVLVEARDLGGTCLNRGCIPTKALLYSSEVYTGLAKMKKMGITVGEYSFDYKKMAKRKDKVVKTLRSGVENLVPGNGAEVIKGKAVMTGDHTFTVNDEEIYAEKIILAMGSKPARIPVPGADLPGIMDSDGVLSMDTCPSSMVIIGGGVIGVEFATLFSNLGCKVTIIEMLPEILHGNDRDICTSMAELLTEHGVTIHTGARLQEIKEGLQCVFEKDGETLIAEGEIVVMAAGRKPVTDDLNLEVAGISTVRGFVPVDAEMRTQVNHIFAIGDITGKQQLAHVASAQGMVAAKNAAEEAHYNMDYTAVPGCIYSEPEIASVGLTEEAARENGYQVKTGRFNVSGNGRSLAIGCQDGFVKLVTDVEKGTILGCHIMAPHATEMIGEAVIAVQERMTAEELGDIIHAHPTVSEIIMEAAHDVNGECCHKI